MTETAHETWTVSAPVTVSPHHEVRYVEHGTDIVAQVWTPCDMHTEPYRKSVRDARAHLIAVAPQMLAALKLLNDVRGAVTFHDGWATLEDGTEIYLGELIAQAEWRS